MKIKISFLIAAFFLSALSVAHNAWANMASISEESDGVMRACEIARNRFVIDLKADRRYDWKHRDYVSSISNYSMGVSENRDSYFVFFKLKKVDGIMGGNILYVVDKKTMEIVRVQKYK